MFKIKINKGLSSCTKLLARFPRHPVHREQIC